MFDNLNKDKILKKGLKGIEKFQFFILIILSLVLIAGVDLITAKIAWDSIKDPYFYISNAINCVALMLLTFGTVYLVLDYLKSTNETYLNAKNEIDAFSVSKNNIPSILSRFLEELNRKRKINQYEHDIIIKLYKLENKVKWYAYLPIVKWFVKNPNYFTEEEMHLWNFGTEEEKQKSKYCRKRKIYEEQLDKDLIEKIIDTKFVKYDKITSATLLNEYYNNGDNTQVNDYITKNETGQIARYRVPTLLISFGATCLVASLVLDGISFNWLALITISTKLLSVAWNIYTSTRYAKKHFNRVTLHDILFRRSIISEYEKWLIQKAEEQKNVEIQVKEEVKQIETTQS